jgi:serine/threonine-protein kinase RsbW
MSETGYIVRLELPSLFDMIDLVQAVSDQLVKHLGLDEDVQHWVGVAVRESVINAMKHGNKGDASKTVTIQFTMKPAASPCELDIRVRDRGEGFDPASLPDPLAPENLLKASGRGIFFMRSFMDDVQIVRAEGGGMEVRMLKRFSPVRRTEPDSAS